MNAPILSNQSVSVAASDNNNTIRDVSASSQRKRLLAALGGAGADGINTIQARRDLNVMMPAARVIELRQSGFEILTIRERTQDDHGRSHWGVARYVMIASPDQRGDYA